MKKARKFLEEVKRVRNFKTDAELADYLNVERPRIADYMTGKRKMDNYCIGKIALVTGRDPWKMLIEIEAEMAKVEKKRKFWNSQMQDLFF